MMVRCKSNYSDRRRAFRILRPAHAHRGAALRSEFAMVKWWWTNWCARWKAESAHFQLGEDDHSDRGQLWQPSRAVRRGGRRAVMRLRLHRYQFRLPGKEGAWRCRADFLLSDPPRRTRYRSLRINGVMAAPVTLKMRADRRFRRERTPFPHDPRRRI